jgi:uncharacterized protein (TIGR00255 family)
MTGFGSVRSEKDGHTISVDIKCLNSKFLDLNMRLPREIQDKEAELRKMMTEKLSRGKVQIQIDLNLQPSKDQEDIINVDLFEKYYSALDSLANKHAADKNDLFRLALQMPEVIKSGNEAVDDELWSWIRQAIAEAADKAEEFRKDEGKSLLEHFNSALGILYTSLEQVETIDVERRKRQSDKLQDALSEIKDKTRVDENRFEQELIYYLEKIDISEEKVRLKSHLDYFKSTLEGKESNGKRLQFISQEIGREINTIGSKANDASLQKVVVGMKDELEKIKEQSLNVL